MDLVKLVNYIRSNVEAGNVKPDVSTKSVFEDDQYLQPVLADDALLYSIEDALEPESKPNTSPTSALEAEITSLRTQLSDLQTQFSRYRTDVQRTMMQNLNLTDTDTSTGPQPSTSNDNGNSSPSNHDNTRHHLALTADNDYFSSYAHPSIHHIMLSDTIRTDAYRDFIYDNKSLFTSQTVLDVGCGTGILSMFSAKAGASQVIAVDNSAIIDKARENVFTNNLDSHVRCLRGKVEELSLPTDKVAVIVSEWMGYCLLYESMLDSVIYARDRYLKADGLMVPSHAALKIAPLADSDVRIEQIDFWRDVYGFDMTGMLERAYEDVIIQSVKKEEVAGQGIVFRELDLHKVTVQDLSFSAPFEFEWKDGAGSLEGFVIWFDMFFAPSRERIELDASKYGKASESVKVLSTSPFGKDTHWHQGTLLLKEVVRDMKTGEKVKGQITYRKAGDGERSLDIDVAWDIAGRKGSQTWKLE